MSPKSISARHRAVPSGSIALQGLSFTAKTHAAGLAKPALVAAATGGLLLGAGAPAQAGTYTQDSPAAAAQAPAAAGTAVHTVVTGDTLGAIAARYGTDLNTVLSQNGLSYASIIYPGQQIRVAGGSSFAPAPAVPAAVAPAPAAFAAVPAAPASFTAPAQAQPGISLLSGAITPIPAAPASAAPTSGVGQALVASAYAQLGSIQDCTVLAERALRSIGKNVGDLGPTQFYQYGTVVGSPAPGDLVIRPGHIAIYVGNGEVISSGMNGQNLTIKHPLSDLAGSSYVRVNG